MSATAAADAAPLGDPGAAAAAAAPLVAEATLPPGEDALQDFLFSLVMPSADGRMNGNRCQEVSLTIRDAEIVLHGPLLQHACDGEYILCHFLGSAGGHCRRETCEDAGSGSGSLKPSINGWAKGVP